MVDIMFKAWKIVSSYPPKEWFVLVVGWKEVWKSLEIHFFLFYNVLSRLSRDLKKEVSDANCSVGVTFQAAAKLKQLPDVHYKHKS